MSHIDNTSSKLVDRLNERLPAAVFDWGALIALLLPLVMQLLSKWCGLSNSREIAQEMSKGRKSWKTRWGVSRATNKACEEYEDDREEIKFSGRHKKGVRDVMLDYCESDREEQHMALIEEMAREKPPDDPWSPI